MLDQQEDSSKTRILVVDDSKVIRKAAVKMLGKLYDVILAEDGEEAWKRILLDEQIQVVFTDLKMPVLDGFGLLERVRTHEDEGIRNLPIVVVTGMDDDGETREKAYELGTTDFITKPFNSTEIKARAQALANYRRETQFLQEKANLDVLTGLLNDRGFRLQLEKDIAFSSRHKEELAVMILELDDFKKLFVSIGRAGADSIIRQVGKCLLEAVRKEDTVARVGLSRFLMSLPTAKPDGAVDLAKRISHTVANFNVKLAGEKLPISLSIGVTTVAKGARPAPSEIIDSAAQALSGALAAGQSKVLAVSNTEAPADSAPEVISIDQVLLKLREGGSLNADDQIDRILESLTPLLKLLSEEQKKKLTDIL